MPTLRRRYATYIGSHRRFGQPVGTTFKGQAVQEEIVGLLDS